MKAENLSIYRIKKGDTLASIAKKYNINPTEILIQNAIVPKQIREGFVIEVWDRHSGTDTKNFNANTDK